MTDFLVKRDDLRECRVAESEAARARARRGAASGRHVRSDREQRHLRGVRRDDVLLGLLPRRGRLGPGADVGLRGGGAKRGPRRRARDAAVRIPAPSSHLVVRPLDADERGFVDASPHRAALPSAYHRYLATEADPFYRADTEDMQMLLRPLFFTSFLIDDLLDREGLPARGPIVISSASSKTAIAAAFLLAQREGVELVGLTSPRSAAFVEGLGIYGRTVPYDAIDSLEPGPATFVDIAGDREVRLAVHSHYGDALVHSMAVGVTHWEEFGADQGELPGPTPSFFFAPDRGRQTLGGVGLRRPRDAGSQMPGTRSASGQPAGSTSSAARVSTRFRAPTSMCSRAASTRRRRTSSRSTRAMNRRLSTGLTRKARIDHVMAARLEVAWKRRST